MVGIIGESKQKGGGMSTFILILIGCFLGWVFRAAVGNKRLRVSARDKIVTDGFNRYRDLTGEPHPEDPRNVILEVVDVSQNS